MIHDSQVLEPYSVISSDVCIIGAGVAGLALASELFNTRASVTIVESGSETPDALAQSLNHGENIGLRYYELDKSRARGFGGTSHLWHCELTGPQLGVRLMAMDEIDFEERDWVPNSGWPFRKAVLDPYYERAHLFCGIGPYDYTPEAWKGLLGSKAKPLFKSESQVETKVFQFAVKELLYKKHKAAFSDCQQAAVYLNATAMEVVANNAATAIDHIAARTPKGTPIRFQARWYVLAAGGLETARLMLASNGIEKCGIGNRHDNVGRYFMEHPHLWPGYIIPNKSELLNQIDLYRVQNVAGTAIMGKLALTQQVQRREQLLNLVTSVHPGFRLLNTEGLRAIRSALRDIRNRKWGGEIINNVWSGFRDWQSILHHGYRFSRAGIDGAYRHRATAENVLRFNVMAEQIPNPESRVRLIRERDFMGMNRIALDWRLTSQDIESIRKSLDLIGNQFVAAGLGRLGPQLKDDSIPHTIHGGWHHMGTTRMDNNPRTGVVDADCRVHGYGNLFIAGASVFPTVGCANPVLTIVAMSLRLGDHLKKHLC
jgi:choline dehydrogenase-like flavoprotein